MGLTIRHILVLGGASWILGCQEMFQHESLMPSTSIVSGSRDQGPGAVLVHA